MQAIVIYTTFENNGLAEAVARILLESPLVACANILPGAQSFYRWEGRIQSSTECIMIAKTMEIHLHKVIDKVKQMHAYTCPCIVSWPLTDGLPDYLNWIAEQTGTAPESSK